jgi:hypothetical protein
MAVISAFVPNNLLLIYIFLLFGKLLRNDGLYELKYVAHNLAINIVR